jgi:ABC-2 type transport system permease protein
MAREAVRGRVLAASAVGIENRLWFNEAYESTYFLVPGLIVLVMTLIGTLLTSLVVAREWERGTFEALFVTPVRTVEVLLGKTIPYFVLGMIGLALSVVGSLLLFDVPFRGSVLALTFVSMLYLLVALGIGLVVSSATKSQFLASQMSMLITFLPAMMLSGFMFDLRSMPWVIQIITYIFPARYFVSLLQTLFLAGNVWSVIFPNAAVLAVMAVALLTWAVRLNRKRIG